MNTVISKLNIFFIIFILFIILASLVIPASSTLRESIRTEGYSKGVSYKSVVPLKKATFVNYEDKNYLDDYAYLASVPTTVFNDGNQLLSSTFLFYQEDVTFKEQKKKILNANLGIDYFMVDWSSFCGGNLDQIICINVENEKLKEWSAAEYITIEGKTPFEIAS